jgi:hypothetical protein
MMRLPAITLLALLLCGAASAHDELERTERSPSGRIIVRHSLHEFTSRIWLASRSSPSRPTLLYEYNRYAEVLFSRDEQWIAITDYCFSNESEVLLFKRKRGLAYEPVEAANIRKKALGLFAKKYHPAELDLHHSYFKAVRWLHNSRELLISLGGYSDGHQIDAWLFKFDVSRLEPRPYPRRARSRAYRNLG